MKKIILVGLFSVSLMAGLALAQQSGEKKGGSPMQGMMEEMMGSGKTGEGGMEGMMQMMKMMEQCGAMMENCCTTSEASKTKEGHGHQ